MILEVQFDNVDSRGGLPFPPPPLPDDDRRLFTWFKRTLFALAIVGLTMILGIGIYDAYHLFSKLLGG